MARGTDLDTDARQAIGQRIKVLREVAGITQVELAKRCYVTQPSVSGWESGTKVPARAMQYRLADELRTSRSMLFREIVQLEEKAVA